MILSRQNTRMASFILLCLLAPFSVAEIYKWTDKNGKVHFSERKPGNTPSEAVKLKNVNSSKAQKIYQHSTSKNTQSSTTPNSSPASQSPFPKTEEECIAEYNLSCDQVFNWEKYAMEACRKARYADCDNSSFLARKFKPVTTKQRQIANRARRARIQRNAGN